MSEMSLSEALERYNESLKRVASRARELGKAQQKPLWAQIAKSIEGIRERGITMAKARSIDKQEVDRQIDAHKEAMVH